MSPASSDQTDLESYRAGDREASRRLIERHGGLVFVVAYRILGDRGLSEDVVQEVFLKLWREVTKETYLPIDNLGAWLCVVTRNRAIDAWEGRDIRSVEPLGEIADAKDQGATILEIMSLNAAIAALPEEDQELLGLHYTKHHTQQEVADILGVDKSTVSRRLSGVYARLRGLIDGGQLP